MKVVLTLYMLNEAHLKFSLTNVFLAKNQNAVDICSRAMHIKHIWSKHDSFNLWTSSFFLLQCSFFNSLIYCPLIGNLFKSFQSVLSHLALALIFIQLVFLAQQKLQVFRLFIWVIEYSRMLRYNSLPICYNATVSSMTIAKLCGPRSYASGSLGIVIASTASPRSAGS